VGRYREVGAIIVTQYKRTNEPCVSKENYALLMPNEGYNTLIVWTLV